MSEEVIVKGFLNEDTLSAGKITKTLYDDREYIEVSINLEGDNALYYSKEVNPKVKGDMPDVIGILQLLDMFVKEVQKAENPESEEEAANEEIVDAELADAEPDTANGQ